MIRLCEMSLADRGEIEALYVRSLKANPQGFIQDLSFHGNIFELLQGFTAQGGAALIIKNGAEVIGMGGLRKVDEQEVELCKLHLNAQWQGQGLGRLLAEALVDKARALGFNKITLHVTVTQEAAIALYTKLGFVLLWREVYEAEHNGETLSFDTQYMERML